MFLSRLDHHEQPDTAEALMREVGAQLREVRLERGEELEQVAEHLRIKPAYLRALEDGDLSVMPGRTYALGFLRSYADHLGFNGNELVVQIRKAVGDLTDRTRYTIRTPLPESRLPKAPLLVLSLAVVAGLYGGWIWLHGPGEALVEDVPEVPAELREMGLGEPPPPEAAAELPAAPQPAPEAGGGGTPARLASAEAGTGAIETPASPAVAEDELASEEPLSPAVAEEEGPVAEDGAPEQPRPSVADVLAALHPRLAEPAAAGGSGEPLVHEPANDDARVILHARGTSWIRVSSAGGDYDSARTLQPGEVFLVPNRADLSLWTGNAGGLEVVVDGQKVAPLGPVGRVMRGISLDPQALLARVVGGPG